MNSSSTYKKFLQLKMITKYGIFSLAFISLTYSVLASIGYRVEWTYLVFFTFAFILRTVLSKAFGLCWIHRSCILYNYTVSVCIVTSENTFQDTLNISKQHIFGVLAIIGIIIFSLVIWKITNKKTC